MPVPFCLASCSPSLRMFSRPFRDTCTIFESITVSRSHMGLMAFRDTRYLFSQREMMNKVFQFIFNLLLETGFNLFKFQSINTSLFHFKILLTDRSNHVGQLVWLQLWLCRGPSLLHSYNHVPHYP